MKSASTAANDNYHFDVEDLAVFQPDAGTAVTNYRLISRPADKNRATIIQDITDILVSRNGHWLIFAEHASDIPKPVEPVVAGLPSGWKRPNDAKNIFLGVLLIGKGQTWADDLTFEVVDRNIAVTNTGSSKETEPDDPAYAKLPKATIKRPINLGFEEGRVP
jgi:hypothetical protein